MSNDALRDRLNREGDNWLERQRAADAMKRVEGLDRRQRNVDVMMMWVHAFIVVGFAALAVWAVRVVSK